MPKNNLNLLIKLNPCNSRQSWSNGVPGSGPENHAMPGSGPETHAMPGSGPETRNMPLHLSNADSACHTVYYLWNIKIKINDQFFYILSFWFGLRYYNVVTFSLSCLNFFVRGNAVRLTKTQLNCAVFGVKTFLSVNQSKNIFFYLSRIFIKHIW